MDWKKNKKETVFELKESTIRVVIHKIHGIDGWYLSCRELGISDHELKAETFDNAVSEAQVIILKRATALYESAQAFAEPACDYNNFFSY